MDEAGRIAAEERHKRKLAERAKAEEERIASQPKIRLVNLGTLTSVKIDPK